MKYWYDTEFLEDGHTIALISIGIVAEDGREYYAVNRHLPIERIQKHEWLMENVWPYLPLMDLPGRLVKYRPLDLDDVCVKEKRTIANEVREFLLAPGEDIELWGYCSAYDHVLLAQLWGPMILRPKGVPFWTNDIQQEAHRLGLENSLPAQADNAHHALCDARWTKSAWEHLLRQDRRRYV